MTIGRPPTAQRAIPAKGVIGNLVRDAGLVFVGALLGLTWAAALRAYMVALAGPISEFTWWGTFGAIILPGAVAGALLAFAWRRGLEGRPSAWFALAPTPLVVVPLLEPGALVALVTSGLGGGAAGVVITGLIGGFALGQRGRLWVRIVCGVPWIALLVGFAMTPALIAGMPATTPEGAWLMMLVVGLMTLFSIACVAPFLARRR